MSKLLDPSSGSPTDSRGRSDGQPALRVVLYSSVFPSPAQPNRGVFTQQLAAEMSQLADVDVVCPVPWSPDTELLKYFPDWQAAARTPRCHHFDAILARYPRYPMLPKVSGLAQPWLQALTSKPAIERIHRKRPIDIINAHWISPDGIAAVWIGRRLGIPVVLTALGCDINEYPNYEWRRKQIRWALTRAAAVTAVSPELVERIVDLCVADVPVHFIGNGVDKTRFHVRPQSTRVALRSELGVESGRPQLLFVGRLAPEKAVRTLLQALSLHKRSGPLSFDTVLIGDGPERREVERDLRRYGLAQQVRLLGELPHHRVQDWMACSDALCLPSLREGMPNVILEALASGLPVVASRVGPVQSMVDDDCGILVDPNDPQNLASALARVMERKWDRPLIASKASAQSWGRAAQRYVEVMRQVVNGIRAVEVGRQ